MGGAHLAGVGGRARLLGDPRQWVPGLRGLHCSWERSFRGLLGPHQLAFNERSRGVRATGKGTGARWCRVEQGTTYSALSVGIVSEPPNLEVTERPHHWGQGLYHFTPSHKARTLVIFPSSLVPAARSPGSPRDLSCLVISFTCWALHNPYSGWPTGPALLPAVCSPVGP